MQTATLDADNIEHAFTTLITNGVPFLMSAVGALAILIIGLFIAGRIRKALRNALEKTGRVDGMLVGFLTSLAYYALVAVVLIAVLGQFGVPTTSFAAILGATGLAIGLALQGTLSHVASGVMLILFKPIELGDYIEAAGHEGSVKEINLFFTELASADNKKIIIPNSKVWDNSIVNYSGNDTRRLDLVFGISYDSDIDKAMAIIQRLIDADDRIMNDPEPVIAVDSLGDWSVDLTTRIWLPRSEYANVKWALLKAVKEAFDKDGISIPFPTQVEYSATLPA